MLRRCSDRGELSSSKCERPGGDDEYREEVLEEAEGRNVCPRGCAGVRSGEALGDDEDDEEAEVPRRIGLVVGESFECKWEAR